MTNVPEFTKAIEVGRDLALTVAKALEAVAVLEKRTFQK